MRTEEFVKVFYNEKQNILEEYLSENSESEVGHLINSLNLTEGQTELMKKIMDTSFTDIYYGILTGLDGCSSIDGTQEMYDLKDGKGNQLSGEIEEYAYEIFRELK